MSLGNNASFPLLKVSLATDPPDARQLSWSHETRDIRVLFDSYGIVTSRTHPFSILTIFQNNDILERVNILDRAREAEEVIEHAQQTGKKLSPNLDIPTDVLYVRRNRTLAIRYRLSAKETRRMQLKFEADVDFDCALSILEELGCRPHAHGSTAPITGARARPESRPASARDFSDFNRPSSRPMSRVGDEDRLRVSSSHFRPSTTASHSPPRASSAGYQAQYSTETRRPATSLYAIDEDRPSQEERHRRFQDDPIMQNIGGYDAKSDSQRDVLRRNTASARPETTIRDRPRLHEIEPLPRPSSMSKLTIAQLDSDFDMRVPPRRELPFNRPTSKQRSASRDGAGERPSSSADLPSLPKPSFINPPLIERGGTAANPDPIGEKRPANKQAGSCPASSVKRPISPAKNAVANRPSTPLVAIDFEPKNAVATSAASGRPLTAASSSSTLIKLSGSTPITSDSVIGSTTPSKDIRAALGRIDAAMPATANAMSSEQEALANYAEMSYEERMKVLENLIIEGVEDENFVTLCEDVNGCWQRIGLAR